MYAIMRDRGKQYTVTEGRLVSLDLMECESGQELTFPEVLLVSTDDGTRVGAPLVEGASVKAVVVGESKGKKIDLLHLRRRKGSMTRKGHRQRYTTVRVEKIETGGGGGDDGA